MVGQERRDGGGTFFTLYPSGREGHVLSDVWSCEHSSMIIRAEVSAQAGGVGGTAHSVADGSGAN